ncbi:hypothetical protein [Geobacter sp.]|uniref:hypothetical protein n=1 Tax=Geobacter sp. TaxID=46610 RepID=UPI0027B8F6F0|nr:hypothetical protein [Geobacter sp.]
MVAEDQCQSGREKSAPSPSEGESETSEDSRLFMNMFQKVLLVDPATGFYKTIDESLREFF